MPDLPREREGNQQVVHRFRLLVAQDTARVVLEASTTQSVCGPAPVLVGEPQEKVDSWQSPAFPDQFPHIAAGGALERGEVVMRAE